MEETVKTARKTYSRVGLYFLIAAVMVQVASILAGVVLGIINPDFEINANGEILYSVIVIYGFGFPLTLYLMKKTLPAQKPAENKVSAGQYILWLIMVLGVAYTSNIVGLIASAFVEKATGNPVENLVSELTGDAHPVVILLYMVLAAPILEELIFRKLIVDRTLRYGKWPAIVISGLMFGLFHGNLQQFVYAFTIGMFFAFIYVKTGKIQITISMHMIFNFLGGFLASRLTKMVDIEYMQSLMESGSMQALSAYCSEHALGILLLLGFGVLLLGSIVVGDILLIVFLCIGKGKLPAGEYDVPEGKRFSTMFFNFGMILYIVLWIVLIVKELL